MFAAIILIWSLCVIFVLFLFSFFLLLINKGKRKLLILVIKHWFNLSIVLLLVFKKQTFPAKFQFHLGKGMNKIEHEGVCTCARIEIIQDADNADQIPKWFPNVKTYKLSSEA